MDEEAVGVKKTTSYRETFRRHRRLLTMPIVVAVFIAAWIALGSENAYQSTATLWVDSPASSDSSLGNINPAVLPPSQQEQNVVTELLTTRSFAHSVAHNSTLARYLATHGPGGFGPGALLSSLGGPGSLDSRILGAVSPSTVTTTIPGPQVLQISYSGPAPAVARSTLQAIVNELRQDSVRFSQQHNRDALAFYRGQVQAASQAVASARDRTNAYLRQHRGAGSGDPNLTALQTAQGMATTQLTQANANYTTAASAAKGGSGSSVAVIDSPSVPGGPVSGKKKQLLAILAGLFAGALISFLGVVALTPGKPKAWQDELAAEPAGKIALDPRHGSPVEPGHVNGHREDPTHVNGHSTSSGVKGRSVSGRLFAKRSLVARDPGAKGEQQIS